MATYLKRTSKLFDISRPQATAEMNLRDLMCPVCRGILIEPVTLPCTHNLCLRCLKGTFEHNSLSCPLCRVRVGSWLRTATKSERLVNGALWELIRSRYPKEIQDKHNDVTDVGCDNGDYAPKILSAAGEIRREYKMQLQIAEAEIRRQRESERIANEELIRKIQEDEEKQKLALLAQDQLLAKTLAKTQLLEKERNVKYYESLKKSTFPKDNTKYLNVGEQKLSNLIIDETKIDAPSLLRGRDANLLLDMKQSVEPRKSNLNLLSKIQAERLALGVKSSILNKTNDTIKSCCDYSTPYHSIVTLKHPSVTMLTNKNNFNYISEPSCSNSKIYGDQNEEELRVPSDLLNSNSNKKSLGIEICVQSQTTAATSDDKRIGSAQSAGSHDSINPEIHHFKPIKAMPRTPLKISQDGRQIDPKLLRVVPILKRISNPILKPPSQHMKRFIGCSWSAFKGRIRQYAALECNEENWKSPGDHIQNYQFTKTQIRPQATDIAQKFDVVSDISIDTNINYATSINRLLNGTKVSKKLILDDNDDDDDDDDDKKVMAVELLESNKSKKQLKNGISSKRKRKNSSKHISHSDNIQNISSCCITIVDTTPAILNEKIKERRLNQDEYGAVENIAERIKRRKVTETHKKFENTIQKLEIYRKSTRSRTLSRHVTNNCIEVEEEEQDDEMKREEEDEKQQHDEEDAEKRKEEEPPLKSRRKDTKRKGTRGRNNKSLKVEMSADSGSTNRINDKKRRKAERATRNSVRLKTFVDNDKDLDNENVSGIVENNNLDECVVQDQQRIERLVMQEKRDYELAQRLQAKYNEMERISGRTRGSKRALERKEVAINNIDNSKSSKFNDNLLLDSSVDIVPSAAKSRRQQRRD